MPGDEILTTTRTLGRKQELTEEQRGVCRQLRAKGQSYEQLAVGFGVSYNTIRSICGDVEPLKQKDTPGADTHGG